MNYIREYTDFLKGFLNTKSEVKVSIDSSNGAAGPVVEMLFPTDYVEAKFFNSNPDGDFPAHGPNPLSTKAIEDISKETIESSSDLGIIFDGDGDRVFFTDEKGQLIDSYDVLRLIKDFFKPPYLVDVRAMSQFTMPDLEAIEGKAGRYFLIKAMREYEAEIGVEYTGHYYFKDFFYTDSGILTAIHMINYVSSLSAEGNKLSEAIPKHSFVKYPEENIEVEDTDKTIERVKSAFEDKAGVEIKTLDGITVYGKDFAFNLRTSVTEPMVRLNLAANNKEILDKTLAEVTELIH